MQKKQDRALPQASGFVVLAKDKSSSCDGDHTLLPGNHLDLVHPLQISGAQRKTMETRS